MWDIWRELPMSSSMKTMGLVWKWVLKHEILYQLLISNCKTFANAATNSLSQSLVLLGVHADLKW